MPIFKRHGISDFTKRDYREHWKNLERRGGHRRQSPTENKTPSIPLNNIGGVYVATIGVGVPPTECESCKFLSRMVSYILAQDQLLVDSGSALTWLGANGKTYVKTKSSVKTKESVVSIASHGLMTHLELNLVCQNTTYSNGFLTGKFTSQCLFDMFTSIPGLLYEDTVAISENITISQQSIGVALNSSGFPSVDGVLA
jgi:hypothetical protein